jgi:hypothetical protein
VDGARDDWTYHGVYRLDDNDRAHILVEQIAFGPTERQGVAVLREIPEPQHGGFLWGYVGGSPTRAAEAILADALDLPDLSTLDDAHVPGRDRDRTSIRLRNDFCIDVLSQLCHEWRLRRGAVLRWVRGWYAEHGITNVPLAAIRLPAIDPHEARRRTDR